MSFYHSIVLAIRDELRVAGAISIPLFYAIGTLLQEEAAARRGACPAGGISATAGERAEACRGNARVEQEVKSTDLHLC